jgi:quercetin dioxygenase-like cupin family protein
MSPKIRREIAMRKMLLIALILLVACAVVAVAQDPKFEPAAKMKMINFPGLPDCAKGAVADGDPGQGAAVIYAKWPAGCAVPTHWHTANERLVIVSGSGVAHHQGGSAEIVAKGEFIFMPAKHQHDFTCKTACEFYIVTDGAFDIHYVDASGNEIPPEQALAKQKPAAGTTKKGGAKKGDQK